mmetsp:Transcript_24004/g.70749  ORF Transcript_24004/g.70749 Transcript_24004/m.70749 type:complete len:263 (+) Transcript_24004:216-1004(+)
MRRGGRATLGNACHLQLFGLGRSARESSTSVRRLHVHHPRLEGAVVVIGEGIVTVAVKHSHHLLHLLEAWGGAAWHRLSQDAVRLRGGDVPVLAEVQHGRGVNLVLVEALNPAELCDVQEEVVVRIEDVEHDLLYSRPKENALEDDDEEAAPFAQVQPPIPIAIQHANDQSRGDEFDLVTVSCADKLVKAETTRRIRVCLGKNLVDASSGEPRGPARRCLSKLRRADVSAAVRIDLGKLLAHLRVGKAVCLFDVPAAALGQG